MINNQRYENFEKWLGFFSFLIYWLGGIGLIILCAPSLVKGLIPNYEDELLYLPDSLAWLWPGLLISFGTCSILMSITFRIALGKEYEDYMAYTNQKHSYNGKLVLIPVIFGLVLLGLIVSYFIFNTYLRLTEDKIISNQFIDMEEHTYNYHEIKEIKHTITRKNQHGQIVPCSDYDIIFKDGYVISTHDIAPMDEKGIEKVISKSGIEPVIYKHQ